MIVVERVSDGDVPVHADAAQVKWDAAQVCVKVMRYRS